MKIPLSELRKIIREELSEISSDGGGYGGSVADPMSKIRQSLMAALAAASLMDVDPATMQQVREKIQSIEKDLKPKSTSNVRRRPSPGDRARRASASSGSSASRERSNAATRIDRSSQV